MWCHCMLKPWLYVVFVLSMKNNQIISTYIQLPPLLRVMLLWTTSCHLSLRQMMQNTRTTWNTLSREECLCCREWAAPPISAVSAPCWGRSSTTSTHSTSAGHLSKAAEAPAPLLRPSERERSSLSPPCPVLPLTQTWTIGLRSCSCHSYLVLVHWTLAPGNLVILLHPNIYQYSICIYSKWCNINLCLCRVVDGIEDNSLAFQFNVEQSEAKINLTGKVSAQWMKSELNTIIFF